MSSMTCMDAYNQLLRWNSIRNEWNDKKLNVVEKDCIEPLQRVLSGMNDKLCEITSFISDTEEKVRRIEEDGDGQCSSSRY